MGAAQGAEPATAILPDTATDYDVQTGYAYDQYADGMGIRIDNSGWWNEVYDGLINPSEFPTGNECGDLTTGWGDWDSGFYVANLTSGVPYENLGLESGMILVQYQALPILNSSFHMGLLSNTTDEIGPNSNQTWFYNGLWHKNSHDMFFKPGSANSVILSIGASGSWMVRFAPNIDALVTQNNGGELSTPMNWTNADIFRLMYTFESVSDKDIIGCGTHLDSKI